MTETPALKQADITSLDDPFWIIWRRAKPLLVKALERADEYRMADVLHYVYTGQWQMWHGEESVAMTRIAHYPEHTACIIILAAGDLEEILDLEPGICAWASRQGCKYVEIYGRTGWKRAFKDYEAQSLILRKELP